MALPYDRGERPTTPLFQEHKVERVVPNSLDRAQCYPIGDNRFRLLRLTPVLRSHPAWLALFVKGGDAFARFVRFTRLHVIFQREIDVSLHGMPPKLLY